MRFNHLLDIYAQLDSIYLAVYMGMAFIGIWFIYADLMRPGKLKIILSKLAVINAAVLYMGLFIFVCIPR